MIYLLCSLEGLPDAVMILLPLAALLLGLGLGSRFTLYLQKIVYEDHLAKHASLTRPTRGCMYCFSERGVPVEREQ